MSKPSATEKFSCEFCNREFSREKTMLTHMCEQKRRWQDKGKPGNRIGFQCWLDFYVKNTATRKTREYLDFVKSAYYLAFVKFGNYCVDVKVINPRRYCNWLMDNKISIDAWAKDTNYNRYLIDYLKCEDPLDAVARSIETAMTLAKTESIATKDYLRYGNRNKICYEITVGRISPWMLYQSESGRTMLDTLDSTMIDTIIDYIKPEQWALKFKRNHDNVVEVQQLLKDAGF